MIAIYFEISVPGDFRVFPMITRNAQDLLVVHIYVNWSMLAPTSQKFQAHLTRAQ